MPYHHLLRDPVLIILFAASLVSWAITVDRLLKLRSAARADEAFRHGRPASDAPLSRLDRELRSPIDARREHLLTVMDAAIALERERLERGLPLLGAIGSTAPYLGLLGTVIGIIQAFQAIQAQNSMSPSVVAGGIATALVATAMGLAVAIPATAAHHLLSAAISRRVSFWEAAVAERLPGESEKERSHESALA